MAQLQNIRTVSVPSIGKLPLAESGNTFTPSGEKREHKAGRVAEDGGHTSTPTPARAELTLNLVPGLDLEALGRIDGENVTVRLTDGSVHLMARAVAEDAVPVDGGTGKLVLFANTSERIS